MMQLVVPGLAVLTNPFVVTPRASNKLHRFGQGCQCNVGMGKRETSVCGGKTGLKGWEGLMMFLIATSKEGRRREGEKKGLAARNFQSIFLPQAKQELGGEAWKRSWEQYAEKTQGLPLSAGEDPTLLQSKCLAVDCFRACMPSLPGCVAKGEGVQTHWGYIGPWQTRGLQTANKDR